MIVMPAKLPSQCPGDERSTLIQVFWQKVYTPPQAFKENKAWLQKTGDLMT